MNARQLRTQLRNLHFIGAGVIGWSIYGAQPSIDTICQWIVFPSLVISGLWMWKQGVIARWAKGRREKD